MFKVVIKNLEGTQTHGGEFATLEQAQAWIDVVTPTGAWGTPEQTVVTPAVLDEEGVEISPEVINVIPATFIIEITDITEQVQKEKKIKKYEGRIAFAQRLMAEISAANSDKYDGQELTLEQLQSAEEKLAKVQRLLLNGSTGLALAEIVAIESTLTEYSQEYKEELKAKIQAYLASEES